MNFAHLICFWREKFVIVLKFQWPKNCHISESNYEKAYESNLSLETKFSLAIIPRLLGMASIIHESCLFLKLCLPFIIPLYSGSWYTVIQHSTIAVHWKLDKYFKRLKQNIGPLLTNANFNLTSWGNEKAPYYDRYISSKWTNQTKPLKGTLHQFTCSQYGLHTSTYQFDL